MYNGETTNIGLNYFTSDKPIWMAGPDIVVSILLTGKVPQLEKAIRMVPHGQQKGLTPTTLRGLVAIDPRRDDFFRRVVEQRHRHKKTDEPLAGFLKTLGNAGSYGIFVEVNAKTHRRATPVTLFAGERRRKDLVSHVVEEPGRWYFPPLATLITASSRLLLAMLERCVRDAGGTYLFTDTDSLCIVAGARERWIPCPGGTHRWRGQSAIKVLSYAQVRAIVNRFAALNPYDREHVPTSILKVEGINFDKRKRPRWLSGFSVSAKRYVLYRRVGNRITLVDPKAHGLGYLYPPIERRNDDDPLWTFDAWRYMLRKELRLRFTAPTWLTLPTMMRTTVSTPFVHDRLNRQTRSFNFIFSIPIDPVVGYPASVDREHFTLIAPFTKRRKVWLGSPCVNIHDGRTYRLALRQATALDRVIPQTFGSILRVYLDHPEAKSLAPEGGPCSTETRGLLRRVSIVAGEHVPIGKETDRRSEHGESLSLLQSRIAAYRPVGKMVVADRALREQIASLGVRPLMRMTGLSQHTIDAIRDGRPVRQTTLRRVLATMNR